MEEEPAAEVYYTESSLDLKEHSFDSKMVKIEE